MTRMLIVDDDCAQLRTLERLLNQRRPKLSVDIAADGSQAIEILQQSRIDVVLTDLQMPGTDGFELLAWLISHQPYVRVFTMTAMTLDDRSEVLEDAGVEHFSKPIDVAKLLDRLSAVIDRVQGRLRNISLLSVLQLLEMERQTCTITVESLDRVGCLYIEAGCLVHAQQGTRSGQDVALEIATWEDPVLDIAGHCQPPERTSQTQIRYLVMEAARLQDEIERKQVGAAPTAEDFEDIAFDLAIDEDDDTDARDQAPRPVAESQSSSSPLQQFTVKEPSAGDAIAIVDAESGLVLSQAGSFDGLRDIAELLARLYLTKQAVVEQLALDEHIEELVCSTRRYWAIARPLEAVPNTIVVSLFDPDRANLAMQRFELDSVIHDVSGWLSSAAP